MNRLKLRMGCTNSGRTETAQDRENTQDGESPAQDKVELPTLKYLPPIKVQSRMDELTWAYWRCLQCFKEQSIPKDNSLVTILM